MVEGESSSTTAQSDGRTFDVAIAGAGLGGMASAILLAQAGLQVACIEPDPFPHARVGESFDWSTPSLLQMLGLSREELIAENIGIYKKRVRVFPLGGKEFDGKPMDWLARWPLRFEITTLHANRVAMDQKLFERACSLGVQFLWDRVAGVEIEGERVTALRTAKHGIVRARWYVDAAGQGRLFAKAFGVGKREFGKRKVCLWTYYQTDVHYEGTSFYGEPNIGYLNWVWEIPINDTTVSVGWITPAEVLEARRRSGKPVDEILFDELRHYPRFQKLVVEQPCPPVRTTSFRCYVNDKTIGPNWVTVGEAASLPDPLTGNGVTAAMRHGKDASRFILASRERGEFSKEQRTVYDQNVRGMGEGFNRHIESCAYEPTLRWGLSAVSALQIYTSFGYLINALYNKFDPQSPAQSKRFKYILRLFDGYMKGWELLARGIMRVRRNRPKVKSSNVGTLNV